MVPDFDCSLESPGIILKAQVPHPKILMSLVGGETWTARFLQPRVTINSFTSTLRSRPAGLYSHSAHVKAGARGGARSQQDAVSQWPRRHEKQRLPPEWTFKWNLAVHLSRCVKFFGYYIKNPFLGNVTQLFKSWKPSSLNGHSPMHQALAGGREMTAAGPWKSPGRRNGLGAEPLSEFRKRQAPAEMALPPPRPGTCFLPGEP